MVNPPRVVVLISANIEWRAVRALFPGVEVQPSPFGEWFVAPLELRGRGENILFYHGGWGKIGAAASTQYVIDRWRPELLLNLGTCGGIEGEIERGTVILADRTIVYDILEQMSDSEAAIAHYTTRIDLSWLGEPYPQAVRRGLLVSADRDLVVEELPSLKERYGAAAGDWESGAIAFVAARNQVRLLILRIVSDLVGSSGGEAYGNIQLFADEAARGMQSLIEILPAWIELGLLKIPHPPSPSPGGGRRKLSDRDSIRRQERGSRGGDEGST